MNCPKCKSGKRVKSGIIKDKQRYLCKECGVNYTKGHRRGKPLEIKRQAIHMYIEGIGIRGIRAIGRLIGVSNVAVLNWIRKAGEEIKKIAMAAQKEVKEVKIMELDEMYHYIAKKKNQSGCGLLLIETTKETFSGNGVIGVKAQQ